MLILNHSGCHKNYGKEFDKNLIKRFGNTYEFCNKNITFCVMLRKEIYPYQYMNIWRRFNKTLLPSKKEFYSSFNMEDITGADQKHEEKHGKNLK